MIAWLIKILRFVLDLLERRKAVKDYEQWRAEYEKRKAERLRAVSSDNTSDSVRTEDKSN